MTRLILPLVVLSLVAGCTRKSGKLQVVSAGGRAHDGLTLWVANRSLYHESRRPRIGKTEVWVDGEKSNISASINSFNSKLGWSESAIFAVPQKAGTASIKAIVTSGGKRYLVTQDWERVNALGPSEEKKWRAKTSSIKLLGKAK